MDYDNKELLREAEQEEELEQENNPCRNCEEENCMDCPYREIY